MGEKHNTTTPENPQNISPYLTESPHKLTDKQIGYLLLRENNIPPKQACEMIGYHPAYGYQVEKKHSKYSLKTNKMANLAHNAVKKLVKGEAFGSIEKVKDSTALQAAQMIFDRVEPVVKAQEQGQSLNFVQVNINMIDNRQPQDIDITPEMKDDDAA